MQAIAATLLMVVFTWVSLTHDEQHLKRMLEVRHHAIEVEEGDN